ncbi:1-acyl-sn-glycerol-3-phosphate acyltransferase [Flaviaesturariibacter flavus]|uniref:1-acyl-sn-glycerol-3-phosphate acyltransferase n=1 Tax=Flaviaesturariibacter flavus TaxID=2502780 RepID=A0A4R1BPG0_9BACT|nr:1-acyl-sn-glycerol-3-phosphate acyltransferase [Flaviaesturariibacter flavus]TCJ19095.1 1-acyl-sn-glycerol-3-phosphate acyltransferase [Flaviaesturariibacter flavus]
MSSLKNILGRVFAVWAALVFCLTLLIVLIPIWVIGLYPEPKRSHIFQPIIQGWMSVFFFLTGVRRRFRGREHFQKGQNYIIVCNHASYMDPPLSSPGIPGANKTIAKAEMEKIPLFGIIYRRGSVLVNRKSEESRKASYGKMRDVLVRLRLHMCIYPEGTRNRTGETLTRFHDGAFKLAVETGKPVIPATLFGSGQVLPTHKSFYFWPHPVAMHFLPPVSPVGKTVDQLRDEVFAIMKQHLETAKP